MLVVVIVLLLAAVGLLSLAIVELPGKRVSADRVSSLAVQERKSTVAVIGDGFVSLIEGFLSRRGWRPFSAEELDLAGIRASVGRVVAFVLICTVIVFILASSVTASPFAGVFMAMLVPILTKVGIARKASKRRREFQKQLAPLLQMMAASLRAGHSLPRAIDAAATDSDSPMQEELGRIVNEYRLGRDLVEAMELVAARMKSLDFAWIAQAIDAQRESGGNLNEILDQVSTTIRERGHLRQQVMSLSAEGRLSAYILMGLPVVIGLYYSVVAWDLMSLFIAAPLGKLLLGIAAVMYVLGGLWMKKIVNIEF